MAFEIIDINTVFGPWPHMRADMSIDRLLAALEHHNAKQAFALSTVGVLHSHNDGNAETLKACQEHEKLVPVATVDPRGYFGPKGALEKTASQGFKMFRFFPVVQEWPVDHAAFHDILDELEPVGVPLMIQAGVTGISSALARVIGDRKNPVLLDGISYENMAEAVAVMRKHENFMIETRELRVPGALRFLVDQAGADRVVFGSGCLRSSLAAALDYIVEAEISDDNKESILGGNVKRLLGG